MHPSQILDARTDLIARTDHPDVSRMWKAHVRLDWESISPTPDALEHNVNQVYRGLQAGLPAAEVFHVVPDMSTLVEAAAAGLDATDRWDHTLAPVPVGLVRFDKGLEFHDIRGTILRINWLLWMPMVSRDDDTEAGIPTTGLFMWNDAHTEPDAISAQIRAMVRSRDRRERATAERVERSLGRWGFIGAETGIDGARLGAHRIMTPDEERQAQIIADGDTPTEQSNITRFVHALWLLLGQTITRTREADVDRPAAGRARAAGLPSRVTVVELRRTAAGPASEPGTVEWSHRWLVRGFWRWNVCGSSHPLAQELEPGKWRARVWVNGFVKGPADKPLVQSEKVYQFRR